MKPFRTRVKMLTQWSREHILTIDGASAEWLCQHKLAVQVYDTFTAFVGMIELTKPFAEVRADLSIYQKPKGKPKSHGKAKSSQGDAGRGLAPLIGRHRVLHYGPGIRV